MRPWSQIRGVHLRRRTRPSPSSRLRRAVARRATRYGRAMLRVLSAVAVALALFAPTASAQTFGEQTSFKWAPNANYLAFAADFNGDHNLDIGVRDTNN